MACIVSDMWHVSVVAPRTLDQTASEAWLFALQSHVEELESKASMAGAYGSSLDRFTDAWQGNICAPPGSTIHAITVSYPR